MKKAVFFVPLSLVGLFFSVYILLASTTNFLSVEAGYAIGEVSRWCERISGGYFREPANALSNLGFMITGLLMFWILANEKKIVGSRFHGPTITALTYATAAVWLGPGSLLMHGTHTTWGQWADWLSMIMWISIPWLVNIFTIKNWKESLFLKTYLFIVGIYGILSWFLGTGLGVNFNFWFLSIALWVITEVLQSFYSPTVRYLSGFVGIAVMAVFGIFPTDIIQEPTKFWWIILFWIPAFFINEKHRSNKRYFPWYWLGIAFYMTAFTIWLQGYPNKPFCNPDSLIQPHAIWHILSSCATLSFFFFFRTTSDHHTRVKKFY